MKRNGFTLVEILAVLVIIGIMALVTVPAVTKSIRDARKEKDDVNIDTVLNAAYDYVQKNPSSLPTSEEPTSKICATSLICAGLLKSEINTQVEGFGSHAITVTYYQTKPDTIPNSSKFFSNYLFTYVEDSGCASTTCTTGS